MLSDRLYVRRLRLSGARCVSKAPAAGAHNRGISLVGVVLILVLHLQVHTSSTAARFQAAAPIAGDQALNRGPHFGTRKSPYHATGQHHGSQGGSPSEVCVSLQGETNSRCCCSPEVRVLTFEFWSD